MITQYRQKLDEVSLLKQIVTRRIDVIGNDWVKIERACNLILLILMTLDDSTNIDDTAQLFNYVRGISENFEITEELLFMNQWKT